MMLFNDTQTPHFNRKRRQPSSPTAAGVATPEAFGDTSAYKRPRISIQGTLGQSNSQSIHPEALALTTTAVDPLTIMIEANSGRYWRQQMPVEYRAFTRAFIKEFIASQPLLSLLNPNVNDIEDFQYKRSQNQSMYLDQETLKKICYMYCAE